MSTKKPSASLLACRLNTVIDMLFGAKLKTKLDHFLNLA